MSTLARLRKLVEANPEKWIQTGRGFGGPREGARHYQLGACTFECDAEMAVAARNSVAELLALVAAAELAAKELRVWYSPRSGLADEIDSIIARLDGRA